VGFGNAVGPFAQGPFALGGPVVPLHLLTDATGQAPVSMVLGQGAQIWFLAKAGVGQNYPALAKVMPGQEVSTDAIAFLLPQLRRNALTGSNQASS